MKKIKQEIKNEEFMNENGKIEFRESRELINPIEYDMPYWPSSIIERWNYEMPYRKIKEFRQFLNSKWTEWEKV